MLGFRKSGHNLPIYTVEKLGFHNLLEKMDLQYNLPSSKYFLKIAIPALYEETWLRLESDFKRVRFFQLQLICGAVLLVRCIFHTRLVLNGN